MNPRSFESSTPPPMPETAGGEGSYDRIRNPVRGAPTPSTDPIQSSMVNLKLSSQLESLEKDYQSEVNKVRSETADEKQAIVDRLETEKQLLLADLYAQEDLSLMKAKDAFDRKRNTIMKEVPTTQECSSCKTRHKILSAICVECKAVSLCETCLRKEIVDECKCSNCSIVVNITCKSCQAKKLREVGWFEFDSCRNGCGYLCAEHNSVLLCQSCGYQCYCDGPRRQCVLHQCGQCNIILCSTCRKSEGCLCKSSFSIFEDSAWKSISRRHHSSHNLSDLGSHTSSLSKPSSPSGSKSKGSSPSSKGSSSPGSKNAAGSPIANIKSSSSSPSGKELFS